VGAAECFNFVIMLTRMEYISTTLVAQEQVPMGSAEIII